MSDKEDSIEKRITLRLVIDPDDEPFLKDLYSSSHEELRIHSDDDNLAHQLMMMQYRAQSVGYAQQFPNASHEVILFDGKSIGRIIVDRRPELIYIVDLALIPEMQSRGIGSMLLRRLLDEGSKLRTPVRLSVLKTNRARGLYERLGFKTYEDDGIRFHMQWTAE